MLTNKTAKFHKKGKGRCLFHEKKTMKSNHLAQILKVLPDARAQK
jgi:hypothetical protein